MKYIDQVIRFLPMKLKLCESTISKRNIELSLLMTRVRLFINDFNVKSYNHRCVLARFLLSRDMLYLIHCFKVILKIPKKWWYFKISVLTFRGMTLFDDEFRIRHCQNDFLLICSNGQRSRSFDYDQFCDTSELLYSTCIQSKWKTILGSILLNLSAQLSDSQPGCPLGCRKWVSGVPLNFELLTFY